MGTNPLRQVGTQLLPYRLRVLQEVQLSAATEQVLQSPVQATAIPEIFTYPEGVVERQEVLWKKTKPGAHTGLAFESRGVGVGEVGTGSLAGCST